MRDILKIGIILMIYALIAGTPLAFVNIKTKPIIEENRLKAENKARTGVLPGMSGGYEPIGSEGDFPYWIGYSDSGKKVPLGYVFIVKEDGYSSTMETMVGVDLEGKINGTKILFQQETPGLGSRIEEILHGETEPWFTGQFNGKSASDNVRITKDGGDINAITGATISSRAVTNSINRGLVKLMQKVGEGS
ncbi:RnfABCDGE type electron transport complex subunit G [Candidatus Latescibacterota bacterium]